jgi:hypothetical protein
MAVFIEHPCREHLNCRGIRSIVALLGVLCAWPLSPAWPEHSGIAVRQSISRICGRLGRLPHFWRACAS